MAAVLGTVGGSQRVKILGIKHLAMAVADCDDALAHYQRFLGVGLDSSPRDLVQGGSREAHFDFGNVQIQLCQSLTPDHRFAQFIAAHGEGLHHACLAVDDVHAAVAQSLAAGAILKECKACGVTGVHEHPEGWIAFLEGDSVPGMEIEFMQVYQEGEMPERFRAMRDR
jgi:methylmalonyl-CoA/ethylmalonyl-CoA epimerase